MQRQLGHEVLREDLGCPGAVRTLDADLDVEPARAQDRRIDEVLAVRGTDDDDVLELLGTVDLGQQVSPTNLLSSSGPLMLRKYERVVASPRRWAKEWATALAMSVLPQPGGP